MRRSAYLEIAAACALAAAPAAAATAPTASSITVSGGVSLGAYEAGFLFYALTAARGDGAVDLRLLTGASAGSLNALLAVLAACRPAEPSPTRSIFWNTWIPVGFDRMFVPSATTPLGVFSREWLERGGADLERAWNQGVDPGCDVVLGISATRAEPRVLHAAAGRLELPRMEEKFAVRIRGRGPGRPPRLTNYVPAREPRAAPLLITDEQGEIAFSELRDLILASMSFPVAFPPQPLFTCTAGETAAPGVCLPEEARSAPYVDGGVFDNAPLRLAVTLARTGLRELPGGRPGWREAPEPEVRLAPVHVSFTFVDPSATEYPAAPSPPTGPTEPSLGRELASILASFVATARSKELAVLLEEHPEIADRILLPRRRFPAAGAPLLAFLGFFETEFRVFDFHLGMYDAGRMLEEAAAAPGGSPVHLPGPAGAPDPGWEALACMRAVYDGGDAAAACRSDALADLRALLQVSLDQLYDVCSAPRPEGARHEWRNPHCERAARGEAPPHVPGIAPRGGRWPGFHRGGSETELAYSMRLLAAYGFRFRDLHVPEGRGDLAVDRIRGALGRASGALAAAQPWRERAAVGFAAKLAADSVAYAPPDHLFHLTLGPSESEFGLSRGFFQSRLPRGVRLAVAAGFRGLEEALSAGKNEPFGIVTAGGIEWQPPPGRSTLAQLRLGLRGGWLFAADDRFGAGACLDKGSSGVSACSRPVAQALVGITALERFRVQVVGEWFPGTATRDALWSIAPGIGFELGY